MMLKQRYFDDLDDRTYLKISRSILKELENDDPIGFDNIMQKVGLDKMQKQLIRRGRSGKALVDYWIERENYRKNNKIGEWSN